MKRTHVVAYGAAILAAAGAAAVSMSGGLEIPFSTSDSGGGFSSGGPYDVGVTFGQQDYRIMSGGNYTLAGGFWPGASPEAGDPLLLTALIKLDACPAPVNLDGHGVVNVVVTGEEGLDVTTLDLTTITLARADGVGGAVAPYLGSAGPNVSFGDLDQPNDLDVGNGPGQLACNCNGSSAPDGLLDVIIPFRTDDLAGGLMLNGMALGSEVTLTLRGALTDGTTFEASDCVSLVTTPGPPGMLSLSALVDGALQRNGWIDVSPADSSLDGGGFGAFDRCYAEGTQVTMTAPTVLDGVRFSTWMVDGQFTDSTSFNMGGANGTETLIVDVTGNAQRVVAVYGSLTDVTR